MYVLLTRLPDSIKGGGGRAFNTYIHLANTIIISTLGNSLIKLNFVRINWANGPASSSSIGFLILPYPGCGSMEGTGGNSHCLLSCALI